MPPHDPEIRMPFRVNTVTNGTLDGNLTFTTTNTNATSGNPGGADWYTTYTTTPNNDVYLYPREYTANEMNINADMLHLDVDFIGQKVRIALEKALDQYFRAIYKVIEDHCHIDISEDEFIKLIKEETDE